MNAREPTDAAERELPIAERSWLLDVPRLADAIAHALDRVLLAADVAPPAPEGCQRTGHNETEVSDAKNGAAR